MIAQYRHSTYRVCLVLKVEDDLLQLQRVEAVKGPKITHKVYFDIEHGGEHLGRSESLVHSSQYSVLLNSIILQLPWVSSAA